MHPMQTYVRSSWASAANCLYISSKITYSLCDMFRKWEECTLRYIVNTTHYPIQWGFPQESPWISTLSTLWEVFCARPHDHQDEHICMQRPIPACPQASKYSVETEKLAENTSLNNWLDGVFHRLLCSSTLSLYRSSLTDIASYYGSSAEVGA